YGAENGFPWSFFLLIAASVTEMAQVAMNEGGHSLWITEEIFAVPFHWPFVFYGWLAAGIFALWAESLIRLLQIEGESEGEEAGEPREEGAGGSRALPDSARPAVVPPRRSGREREGGPWPLTPRRWSS